MRTSTAFLAAVIWAAIIHTKNLGNLLFMASDNEHQQEDSVTTPQQAGSGSGARFLSATATDAPNDSSSHSHSDASEAAAANTQQEQQEQQEQQQQQQQTQNPHDTSYDAFNTPSVKCRLEMEKFQNDNIDHWMRNPEYPLIEWIWELTNETTGEIYYEGLFHVLLCGEGTCSPNRAKSIAGYDWTWQDQFGASHPLPPMSLYDLQFEPRIHFRMDPPKTTNDDITLIPKSLVAVKPGAGPFVYDLQPYLNCNRIEKANPPPPEVKIGACISRFLRQHDLMPEWIAYHRMIGIQHFFIFISEPFESIYQDMPRHEKDITYIPYNFTWNAHKHNGNETMVTSVRGFNAHGENWFQSYANNQCLYMAKQHGLDWIIAPDVDEYIAINDPSIKHFGNPSPLQQFFQKHKLTQEPSRCQEERRKDGRRRAKEKRRQRREQQQQQQLQQQQQQQAQQQRRRLNEIDNNNNNEQQPQQQETEAERRAKRRQRFRQWHKEREERQAKRAAMANGGVNLNPDVMYTNPNTNKGGPPANANNNNQQPQQQQRQPQQQQQRQPQQQQSKPNIANRPPPANQQAQQNQQQRQQQQDQGSPNHSGDSGNRLEEEEEEKEVIVVEDYNGPIKQICLYGASYGKHMELEQNKRFELSIDFTHRKDMAKGSGECRGDGHGSGGRRKCFYNAKLVHDVHVHGMKDDEPYFRGTSHADVINEIELFHFRSPLLGPRHTKEWVEVSVPSHRLVSYPRVRDMYREKILDELKRLNWPMPKFGKHVCEGYNC